MIAKVSACFFKMICLYSIGLLDIIISYYIYFSSLPSGPFMALRNPRIGMHRFDFNAVSSNYKRYVLLEQKLMHFSTLLSAIEKEVKIFRHYPGSLEPCSFSRESIFLPLSGAYFVG